MDLYKNKFLEKYKHLHSNSNNYNQEIKINNIPIFLLSLILHKDSKILQIGHLDKITENYILSIVNKNNYVKFENTNFNLNKYQSKNNISFNTIIFCYYRKTYDFCIQYSSVFKQIDYLFFFYNDRTKLCEGLKNVFVKKRFNSLLEYKWENNENKDNVKGSLSYKNIFNSFNQKIKYEIFKKGDLKGEIGNFLFSFGKNKINVTSIINHLITKYKFKKYFEIGVADGMNFNNINIDFKIGIDPEPSKDCTGKNIFMMNSDEYFEYIEETNSNNSNKNYNKYDIIFIDGSKDEYQVDKDIQNSLKYLNENGFILLKNCNPLNKRCQTKNQFVNNYCHWNGTIWRSYVKFRILNPKLLMYVINCDWGVGIIKKGFQKNIKLKFDFTYKDLDLDRINILQLISVYDFLSIF